MPITIKRARKTVDLCTDLSLREEWEAAGDALDKARVESNAGMEVNPARLAAAKRQQDAQAAMDAATLTFTIEALSRKDWNEFAVANPPREDNEGDLQQGCNLSKLDAVIAPSIVEVKEKVSGKAVAFDAKTEWPALADDISDGQWQAFALAALNVNRGVTRVPFSQVALKETLRSEATSS